MRSMFSSVRCEYIWWFDDDSYIEDEDALQRRLDIAKLSDQNTVIWGHQFYCSKEMDFQFRHGRANIRAYRTMVSRKVAALVVFSR